MADTVNLELFLKVIKAVAKQNGHLIPPHLTPIAEGRALPESGGIQADLNHAGQILSDTQCACLFANVANLNFKDGRIQNRELLRDAEDALRIDSRDARDVLEAVETRFTTQQSFRRDNDWILFCAGLIAMAKADGVLVDKEQQYIQRFIPELKHLEAGQKMAAEKSPNDLGEALAKFTGRQRRCLATHVTAIMFIDGEWKGSEQEFLEIAERRMKMVQFDKERIMKGIFTLFNVSVFG